LFVRRIDVEARNAREETTRSGHPPV